MTGAICGLAKFQEANENPKEDTNGDVFQYSNLQLKNIQMFVCKMWEVEVKDREPCARGTCREIRD